MSDLSLLTQANKPRRARQVNYATNGYPTRVDTLTQPTILDGGAATSQVMFPLTDLAGGGKIPNGILINPFGIGNDDTTFSLRVLKWDLTFGDIGTGIFPPVWTPTPLVEVACTLSTATGVATGYVLNTERYADTITLTGTTGNQGINVDINSPANNTKASLYVDLKGAFGFEIIFTTGGSATSCNALWKCY